MQDKRTKKILILSISGLIVLRFFSLLLIPNLPHLEQYIISNIPDVEHGRYSGYFSAIHEGDDLGYYTMAARIYNFDFKESFSRGLAFPLMIVPFIFIFGNSFASIFLPVVLFNGIALFSLALILIVWSSFLIFSAKGRSVFGGKKVTPAILSGFLFLIFPFIFYVFRNYGPQFKTGAWNDINFFNMYWLAVMTDPPVAFFTLLILFLLLIAERKKGGLLFYSLIGFLAGFSAMIRISNIVIVAAAASTIFLYEIEKKYKKIFFYCLFAFLGFLPQFIYNFVFFGSPFSFGYQKEYSTDWVAIGAAKGSMWDFQNFFHLIGKAVHYSLFAIPAFLIIFVIVLLGFLYIRKINKCDAFIAVLWFLLPAFIYMFFDSGQAAMRYYLPAVPAFIILSVAALWAIIDWFNVKLFRYKIN